MAQRAPRSPALQTLRERYPLSADAKDIIAERRGRTSDAFNRSTVSFVTWMGGCALTLDEYVADSEARTLDMMQRTTPGLVTGQRNNFWKPRTNPKANHGLETEPETVEDAYRIVARRAATTANAVAEIGHPYHIRRYGPMLTAAWIGGRNVTNTALIEAVALKLPKLPLGIKNGLDGDITIAQKQADMVNNLRGPNDAPAIVIYRGGENARNPVQWESQYMDALNKTNGNLIADIAHGGEQAFAPFGNFAKTDVGQIACMGAVIRIAELYGELPIGIMMEATNSKNNPVDPPMQFDIGVEGALYLNEINNRLAGVRVGIA